MDEVCDVLRRFDDERDYDDMSEAALLKRKREERSNWNVTRAHARDTDAEMREHRGTQGYVVAQPGYADEILARVFNTDNLNLATTSLTC
tara:strand:+ start:3668 stop:3937 length:270 start_codon:yes stop_codon:yes gene_type:complete